VVELVSCKQRIRKRCTFGAYVCPEVFPIKASDRFGPRCRIMRFGLDCRPTGKLSRNGVLGSWHAFKPKPA
jgi:hypothetical protein